METLEQNHTGEFNIHYRHVAKINEEYPENDLQGLCRYIFEGIVKWGDPVKITFPDGKVYTWGEYGTWLAHQFAAEGKISEEQFLSLLYEHSQEALVMAKQNFEETQLFFDNCKNELKSVAQSLHQISFMFMESVDKYSMASKALLKLESEANHDNK